MAQYCPFEKNRSFSVGHRAFHEGNHKKLLLTQLYDHAVYILNEDSIQKLCVLSFNTPEQISGNTQETSLYELHQSQKKKSIIRTIENVIQKDSILYATYIWGYRTRLFMLKPSSTCRTSLSLLTRTRTDCCTKMIIRLYLSENCINGH